MGYFYWLSLLGFIALLVLGGRFSYFVQKETDLQGCFLSPAYTMSPHPFLSGHKIKITQASIGDIASLEGLSEKKAQAIVDYFIKHPEKPLEAVLDVKGIGPKTLEKLSLWFF